MSLCLYLILLNNAGKTAQIRFCHEVSVTFLSANQNKPIIVDCVDLSSIIKIYVFNDCWGGFIFQWQMKILVIYVFKICICFTVQWSLPKHSNVLSFEWRSMADSASWAPVRLLKENHLFIYCHTDKCCTSERTASKHRKRFRYEY